MGGFGGDDDNNDSQNYGIDTELDTQIQQEQQEENNKRAALFGDRLQIVKDQLGQNFTGSNANKPIIGK